MKLEAIKASSPKERYEDIPEYIYDIRDYDMLNITINLGLTSIIRVWYLKHYILTLYMEDSYCITLIEK